MSDRKNNPIKRQKVDVVSVTGEDRSDEPITAIEVDVPEKPKIKIKEPMLKRLLASKIFKGIASVVGGAVGLGGSVFAGLDPEFAIVVAATAVIAIFMGLDKAAKFYGIFKEDLKDSEAK